MATVPTEEMRTAPPAEPMAAGIRRMPAVGASTPKEPAGSRAAEPWGGRLARWSLALLGAALVVLAARAPVWEARLHAPQYPDGLRLTAYADRVEGDLREINQLNHYVGMETFDIADVPEKAAWIPVIGLTLLGVVMGSALPRRMLAARLARFGLWMAPAGALVDVQFRLYQFGHSVDPAAAISLEPFTPLVIGPTKVLNFTTWGYPGSAVLLIAAAAALVSFGPGLVARTARPRPHTEA